MYLFFVRAFNDIDHITPIVWKMNRDGFPVAVYCTNPEYEIQSDYRLNFLIQLGIKVDFLYNDFDQNLGWRHRILRFLMFGCYALSRRLGGFSKIAAMFLRETGKLLYSLLKSFYYRGQWAAGILERSGARALCFDHVRPRQYIVNFLLQAAAAKSIPALALPHGVYIYTNKRVKDGSTRESRYDKFNRFDYIITQNELRKEDLARAGVRREKILALGSARYCDEWIEKHRDIIPRMLPSRSDNSWKLKVVFMTTRPQYRIDVDRMMETFQILSNLEGIEAVIKPHTRTGKEAHIYQGLALSNLSEVSSVELSQWADVVLVIGSSILIEALTLDKPVLYLKYLHANTTQYEEMGACWTIRNEDELKSALAALQQNPGSIPYASENVEQFLAEIIYGGNRQRDVLKDYEQFIVKGQPL
jgi:hypothetical protein